MGHREIDNCVHSEIGACADVETKNWGIVEMNRSRNNCRHVVRLGERRFPMFQTEEIDDSV